MTHVPYPPKIQPDANLTSLSLQKNKVIDSLIIPKYTQLQINTLLSAEGSIVYNIDTQTLMVYTLLGWQPIAGSSSAFYQQIVGTGNTGPANQGQSVSIYQDTLVIGGPNDDTNIGAAWVFTRENGVWTQQGAKLVGTGNIGPSFQGVSVSLYQDTLVVGGYGDDSNIGAVWVFTRTNGVWTQQGSKLVGTGAVGSAAQGYSVSIYQDTVAVGGFSDDTNIGATWVFTRTNGVWTQQGSKLIGTGAVGQCNQGISVSLYQDTLVVSGPQDDTGIGAVWVFTRGSGIWTQQGSKLIGTGAVGPAGQGRSVSVYQDNLVVGGSSDNSGIGATWIFTRASGIWSQQGSKLVGTSSIGTSNQGYSVSVYQDTLVIGGPSDNSGIGAIWVFKRYNNIWTQQGAKVVNGAQLFGFSISLYDGTYVSGTVSYLSTGGAIVIKN
jgi:hypothetical protein